jgi:hypothetical protein
MRITVAFNPGRLSDRAINLLLRGSSDGDRPKVDLVREISDVLTGEALARQSGRPWPSRNSFEIDPGIASGDCEAVADALHNLTCDVVSLEKVAALSPAGSPERDELTTAAEFLFCVAAAIFDLRPSRRSV